MTPEKDPFNYSWVTYAWVIAIAMLGGLVNFTRKMREGIVRAFNLTEFLGEIVTSGFAGLLTFWLCEWSGVDRFLAAFLIGISGHMGSRVILELEKWAMEKWERKKD